MKLFQTAYFKITGSPLKCIQNSGEVQKIQPANQEFEYSDFYFNVCSAIE